MIIHGFGEPQSEYERVDVGELYGKCAPEVDDGEEVTDDENVQTPMCMPSPKVPTAAEKALHDLTHMPYRSWWPWCVAGRPNNSHHRFQKNTTDRTVPRLYLDDCFLKDDVEDPIQIVLVGKLKPVGTNSGSTLAVPVNAKGPTDQYGFEKLHSFAVTIWATLFADTMQILHQWPPSNMWLIVCVERAFLLCPRSRPWANLSRMESQREQ